MTNENARLTLPDQLVSEVKHIDFLHGGCGDGVTKTGQGGWNSDYTGLSVLYKSNYQIAYFTVSCTCIG